MTLTGCTFSGNSAGNAGGGINNDGSITVNASTFDSNAASFGAGYSAGGAGTITDCTFSDNQASFSGGGAYAGQTTTNMTLTGCTFSGNSASMGGGGLYNHGMSTLDGCTLSGNSGSAGGGLLNLGTATLTNSTLAGNSASLGSGGGLFMGGTTTLTNCTLSGNSASQVGGGFYGTPSAGTATLTNCTVSGNFTTQDDGGGIYLNGTAMFNNTIVAGNTNASGANDISGAGAVSGANNLIGTGGSGGLINGVDGNMVGVPNPGLAPPGNYGGPTQTMALLLGSPAIGKGIMADYPGTSTPITTDQRGAPRGSVVDIGAFQTSLVVESTSGSVDTTAADLTLPGAVSLANQFAGSAITFDPAVFATQETITLTAQLELSDTALTTSIAGPAAGRGCQRRRDEPGIPGG